MNLPKRSTIQWSTIVGMVGWAILPLWVAPAAYYNLDWAGDDTLWHNLSAMVFIAAAAACFLGLHALDEKSLKLCALALGVCLTCNNSWNALESVATVDHRRIDRRLSQNRDIDDGWSASSRWSIMVESAKLTVQDRPAAELQAELSAYTNSNARRWTSSARCTDISVKASEAFCAEVARRQGLVNTAKTRDETLAKIEAQRQVGKGQVKHTNADDMATSVATMFAPFGMKATPDVLQGIRAWRGATKTLSLEALAAVMPVIWLALCSKISAWMRSRRYLASARAARREIAVAKRPIASDSSGGGGAVTKPIRTPEFLRWVADEMEAGDPTWSIGATPAYELHCEWCKRHKLAKISQKLFGQMMGEVYTRDRNNGYPRYLGVRRLIRGPKLAVSNS